MDACVAGYSLQKNSCISFHHLPETQSHFVNLLFTNPLSPLSPRFLLLFNLALFKNDGKFRAGDYNVMYCICIIHFIFWVRIRILIMCYVKVNMPFCIIQ